jgi:hypothetical protein
MSLSQQKRLKMWGVSEMLTGVPFPLSKTYLVRFKRGVKKWMMDLIWWNTA